METGGERGELVRLSQGFALADPTPQTTEQLYIFVTVENQPTSTFISGERGNLVLHWLVRYL
jgi:hypothetical protein